MSTVISAIGTATPSFCISQNEILGFMIDAHELNERDAGRLRKLYEVSGIDCRHSVIPDFGLPPEEYTFFGRGAGLAPYPTTADRSKVYEESAWQVVKAAVDNLHSSVPVLNLASITHIITVSCTGMYAPGLDIDLVEKLGLNSSIERTCINFMGCYGAFNALKMADYICRAQPQAIVLIADVELCTLHFQKENSLDNWIANSLFSDGAAAVLLQSDLGYTSRRGLRLKSFYNALVTEARGEMGWRIGNTGFEMLLSSQIAKKIKGQIKSITDELLKRSLIPFSQIDRFAIHPGGRRILEVCEDSLNLEEESLEISYDVLRRFGNMSSSTILFVLARMMQTVDSGEKVLSFAFGPGLTFESMVVEAV